MNLYIYFMDLWGRVLDFQRRIGWDAVDYILLALFGCWLFLALFMPWNVLIPQGTFLLGIWIARAFIKYIPNWRKSATSNQE